MKGGVSTNEMQDALARVERARQARTNAARRLKRAEEAVRTAASDVSEADEELKAASSSLDQAVRRGLSAAMKKGGTDMSIAMAELIARSLGATSQEDGGDASPDAGGTGGAEAAQDSERTPSASGGDADDATQGSLLDDAA